VTTALLLLLGMHAASATTEAWTDALTLTDRLAWASHPREVSALLNASTDADGLFSRAYGDDHRDHAASLDRPTLYAVEMELVETFLIIDMAVAYTNTSRHPIRSVVFRVLGNGRGDRQLTSMRPARADGVLVPWRLDGSLLEVGLPEPLRPGDVTRIHLQLAQRVPKYDPDPERWPRQVTVLGTGAFGHSDGDYALGFWLPQITRLLPNGQWDNRRLPMSGEHTWFEPSQFHVVLDVPKTHAVATTGVEVNRATTGDRTQIVAVASGARDFAIHLARGYEIQQQTVAGVRLRVFYPAEHPEIGDQLLHYGGRAMNLFTKWFGPLPIRELDIVDAQVRIAMGMEYDGLVTVDARTVRGDVRDPAQLEWTVVHEVAHQWWYAEVGNDSQAEPWVDEGLANASTALYWEAVYGRPALEERWERDIVEPYRQMLDEGIPDARADLHGEAYLLEQYLSVIYGRSALFFDRVRQEIGDAAFSSALRSFHESYHCTSATGADLLTALKQHADDPKQVDFLYRRWIAEAHGAEDVITLAPDR